MARQHWNKTREYEVRTVSLQAVKGHLDGDPRGTNQALAEAVMTRHPSLSELPCDFVFYRAPYWELVLLAAALAEGAGDGSFRQTHEKTIAGGVRLSA